MPVTQSIAPSVRAEPVNDHARTLRREGWALLPGLLEEGDLEPLRREIGQFAALLEPGLDAFGPQSRRTEDATRATIYRGLRYLPGLMRLATHAKLLDLVSDLGILQPAIMQSHNVRMDGPGDDVHLFHWHQDFTYLLGSPNAVTLWIPLTSADTRHGTVELIPHSHRQGVLPVVPKTSRHVRSDTSLEPRDLELRDDPAPNETILLRAEPGDVAVFSVFAVHRSTANLSDRIRWTAQLRYADLASRGFREAGYPFGDATNIFHCGYRGAFYDPQR